MALPNNDPIYSKVGDIQSNGALLGPTANTAQDGTGTLYPVWQAGATNGGFLSRLLFESVTTTAATVCRVFLSSITGSWTGNTAANTWKIGEISLPAVTVSQTAQAPHLELPVNLPVPPGYRIVVSFGTSTGAGTTGWIVVGVGGKY